MSRLLRSFSRQNDFEESWDQPKGKSKERAEASFLSKHIIAHRKKEWLENREWFYTKRKKEAF